MIALSLIIVLLMFELGHKNQTTINLVMFSEIGIAAIMTEANKMNV